MNTLLLYMQTTKPYLKEGFTIPELAVDTNTTLHNLSYILNTHLNKSFPDFINEFRVNEAIQLLKSVKFENHTIESIGYECGFGSKTSFNKAFKKVTNLTPSEYRKID